MGMLGFSFGICFAVGFVLFFHEWVVIFFPPNVSVVTDVPALMTISLSLNFLTLFLFPILSSVMSSLGHKCLYSSVSSKVTS